MFVGNPWRRTCQPLCVLVFRQDEPSVLGRVYERAEPRHAARHVGARAPGPGAGDEPQLPERSQRVKYVQGRHGAGDAGWGCGAGVVRHLAMGGGTQGCSRDCLTQNKLESLYFKYHPGCHKFVSVTESS